MNSEEENIVFLMFLESKLLINNYWKDCLKSPNFFKSLYEKLIDAVVY